MKNLPDQNKISNNEDCNTIWDFFKSPLLYKFICHYYEWVTESKRKKLWKRNKPSWEFYEFIWQTFWKNASYKEFLKKLRNSLLEDSPQGFENVSTDKKIEVLLAFMELYKILSRNWDKWFDIQSYFETPSSSLIYEVTNKTVSNIGKDIERLPIETDRSLYELLKEAIELWCAITDEGNIVYVLWRVSEKVFNVVELDGWNQTQVNNYGTLIKNTSQWRQFLTALIDSWSQIH
jgi:hypothetical protein